MRRRIGLAVAALAASACGGDLPAAAPTCDAVEVLAIQAQAVPEAGAVPCIEELPLGWEVTTFDVESGIAVSRLSHDLIGADAVTVTLQGGACATPEGEELALGPGEDQERVEASERDRYLADHYLAVPGACVHTRSDVEAEGWGGPLEQLRPFLLTVEREVLRRRLLEQTGGALDLGDIDAG